MEAIGQLLRDNLRFAALDTGCCLKVPFGMKREGKKRNSSEKDYPGHPETAHLHDTHDVIEIIAS